MSLSSKIVHRSKSPSTTLRVVITNEGDRAITLRSSGDQDFIGPFNEAHDISNAHRITSAKPPPSIRNFSITKICTGEEFIRKPTHTCSLTIGSGGWSRRGLTTLEPCVPFTHEFVFLKPVKAVVEAMGDDDEFCLRLRPLGVWWFPGTLGDIFGNLKTVQRLPGPCLPLILQSDDELQFRLED